MSTSNFPTIGRGVFAPYPYTFVFVLHKVMGGWFVLREYFCIRKRACSSIMSTLAPVSIIISVGMFLIFTWTLGLLTLDLIACVFIFPSQKNVFVVRTRIYQVLVALLDFICACSIVLLSLRSISGFDMIDTTSGLIFRLVDRQQRAKWFIFWHNLQAFPFAGHIPSKWG
jgi:hypothetical protein